MGTCSVKYDKWKKENDTKNKIGLISERIQEKIPVFIADRK